MLRNTLRQLLRLALLLLAVSAVAFFLVGISPVDPVQANVGQAAYVSMSAAKRAQLAQYWGVDVPIWQRYLNWLWSALHGDLGVSLRYNAPVAQVLAWRSGNTLLLISISWVCSGVLGLVLGIWAAMRRDGIVDKLIKGYCFVLASVPTFWLGLLFLMVFAVGLHWFPIGFSMPIGKLAETVTPLDTLHPLVLPAVTLSVVAVALKTMHTREKAIDVLESDYLRFARARGMGAWEAMRRHGLRNLALPAITLQFGSISEIFGGSVLVEQVFSYPGLGQAAVTAGLGGDAALLCGIAVVSASLVFVGNLTANVLYGIADPRMRDKGAPHA